MDEDFQFNAAGLKRAIELLGSTSPADGRGDLPAAWPVAGAGPDRAMELLAPVVLGGAARLGGGGSFAHMDPPTPWISWATALWNASLNQNLLHPATSPAAREIERRVIDWLAPCFGMDGGHMTPGSSVANLTALWAARECAGVDTVLASASAHLSVLKAARILGLRHRTLPVSADGSLAADCLGAVPGEELARCALVLTAGTTSTGAIDTLDLAGKAAWTHVDAAWGGPLMFSERHAHLLAGIERADSVAVSAHKWLFQPKESALVLFRQAARAQEAISFGGAYLAAPNIGVLGSHGAAAVPLLATLIAWGRQGLASRIDRCMDLAERWADIIAGDPRLMLRARPQTGVVVWRPTDAAMFESLRAGLPTGSTSSTVLDGQPWFRNVSANPDADVGFLATSLAGLLGGR